jgi:hypothetical protein
MSAKEAYLAVINEAKDSWADHTITVEEAARVSQKLATLATQIKAPDAKEGLVEAAGMLFDLVAKSYDIPFVPDIAERRIEGYIKSQVLVGVGTWYDNFIGASNANS